MSLIIQNVRKSICLMEEEDLWHSEETHLPFGKTFSTQWGSSGYSVLLIAGPVEWTSGCNWLHRRSGIIPQPVSMLDIWLLLLLLVGLDFRTSTYAPIPGWRPESEIALSPRGWSGIRIWDTTVCIIFLSLSSPSVTHTHM